MKLLQGGNIQGVVHPFVISPRGTLPISRTGGDWSGARGAGRHQRIGRVQWVAAPGVGHLVEGECDGSFGIKARVYIYL